MAVLAVALRAPFVAPALEDHDSVNFALALDRYDVAASRPHFPGYPVYIVAARAFRAVGADPVLALVLPGLLAMALLAIVVTFVAWRIWGGAAALLGGLAIALHPALSLESCLARSDALGAGLSGAAAALLLGTSRPRGAAAAFGLLGLSFGVRLSYAPLALGFLAVLLLRRAKTQAASPSAELAISRALAALAGGVAVWAIPQGLVVGPLRLATAGTDFIVGHFGRFGGSLLTESRPGGRFGAALGGLLAHGLGLGWPSAWIATVLIGAGALAVWRVRRPSMREGACWLALVAPYLLWVFLGQNARHARHFLPLAPVIALLLARSIGRTPSRLATAGAAIALGGLAIASVGSAARISTTPSPAAAAAQHVGSHVPSERTELHAGRSASRLLGYYAPAHRVTTLDTPGALVPAMSAVPRGVQRLAITDANVLPIEGREVARFERLGDRAVALVEVFP